MSDVTTIEADVPERYADAVSARLQTAADEDVVGRIWRKDGTLWAPEGTPEVTNRLGWLDIAERSKEQLAGARRASATSSWTRATPTRSCSAWAARASRPRSSASPSARRTARSTLHVLDSTHPQEVQQVPRHARPRQDARDRVEQVRRDDRADVDVQGVQRPRRAASTSSRSPTPAPRSEQLADDNGFRQRLLRRPGHRRPLQRALRLRARPRGGRGVRRRRPCSTARSAPRRSAGRRARQRRPVARLRARRARPPGPRQAHVRRRRAAELLRRLGRAAVRRVHRQARPRHPADRRRAAARPRGLRRRPRLPARRARRRRQRGEARAL